MTTYVFPLPACSCGDIFRTRDALDKHLSLPRLEKHRSGMDQTAEGCNGGTACAKCGCRLDAHDGLGCDAPWRSWCPCR